MSVNVELLEEVMQQIKDHPEQHYQGWWFKNTPECGSAMCFAGWTCHLNGWLPLFGYDGWAHKVKNQDGEVRSVMHVAAQLLGLELVDDDDCPDLFRPENTKEDLELMVKDLVNKAQHE